MAKAATKRSKYRNKPCVIDGIRFHSQKEGMRYVVLKQLERAGEIAFLDLQERFPLLVFSPSGMNPETIGEYRADFSYTDLRKKQRVVEDVKGFKTDLYRWKKKHVEAQYGIEIKEV